MNTRLQVEHPVTEMITGEDLVEWQLRVAAGEALPKTQQELRSRGHAIEVRLCAENPANDFLPETGKIGLFRCDDPQARLDTGVREGDEISVFYDPMIAKVIVHGADRAESARRMQAALASTALIGVKTNLAFLERVVRHPAFLAGDTDTGFIERHRADLLPSASAVPAEALDAAAARVLLDEQEAMDATAPSPWNDTGGWRLNQPPLRQIEFRLGDGSVVTVDAHAHGASSPQGHVARFGNKLSCVPSQGRFDLELVDPFHYETADTLPDARLTALMPGRVVKVMAGAGDSVKKGQALMILEAMKMEHTIVSPRDGIVDRVAFHEGDLVPADAVLVAFKD
jgi:Acetyl/propionyl-CoA carboxylase, alpha subunit